MEGSLVGVQLIQQQRTRKRYLLHINANVCVCIIWKASGNLFSTKHFICKSSNAISQLLCNNKHKRAILERNGVYSIQFNDCDYNGHATNSRLLFG